MEESRAAEEPMARRRQLAGLFLFLLALSVLFFRGTLETSDEQLMAYTSVAIGDRFSLTFEEEVYGQRFTDYGVGMPLAGVPAFFVEKWARQAGLLASETFTLFPLTSALLFALTGLLLAIAAGREVHPMLIGGVVAASPLLPLSLTFYSENLTVTAVASIVACRAVRHSRAGAGVAFVGGAAMILARLSSLPLLTLLIVWLCSVEKRRVPAIAAGAGGLIGLLITAFVNLSLRGNVLATGYEGQSFTTPVAAGLFGLLLSPERGLLIFWPVVLAPIVAWRTLTSSVKRLVLLGFSLIFFSLIFHASFWTWHGGWTSGPRFLLPAAAPLIIAIAQALAQGALLDGPTRLFLFCSAAWSLTMAVIYAVASPMPHWRELWGIHQQENQWLFVPQLSLWFAVLSGYGSVQSAAIFLPASVSTVVVIAVMSVAVVLLFLRKRGRGLVWMAEMIVPAVLVLWTVVFLGILGKWPFGATRGFLDRSKAEAHATVNQFDFAGSRKLTGVFHDPLSTPVKFHIRTDLPFELKYDEVTVAAEARGLPLHWRTVEIPSKAGKHVIEILAGRADGHGTFNLYWTWGGEGIYLAPVGGEYVTYKDVTPLESFFMELARKRFLIVAAMLAFLLLLRMRKRVFSA